MNYNAIVKLERTTTVDKVEANPSTHWGTMQKAEAWLSEACKTNKSDGEIVKIKRTVIARAKYNPDTGEVDITPCHGAANA